MNNNAKNKFLVWAVVILLIANAATLTVFWKTRLEPPPPPAAPASPGDYLSKEIGFSETQNKAFLQLVQQHRQSADALRLQIKNAKDHFFDLVKQPDINDSVVVAAENEVTRYQQELDILTFEHFQKVRQLCTPEQQIKFDSTLHKVMQQITAPRPPGGAPIRPGDAPPPRQP